MLVKTSVAKRLKVQHTIKAKHKSQVGDMFEGLGGDAHNNFDRKGLHIFY